MPEGRVFVTGATGYVGGRLVPRLLEAGYRVRVVVRSADRLQIRPWASHPNLEVAEGDVLDRDALTRALDECQAAYYLVRSQEGIPAAAEDHKAAETLAVAAAAAGVRRIIYLSNALPQGTAAGEVLRAGRVPVTVLRAGMIIGSGSVAFEILRHLVDRHPAMIAPRWIETPARPIAIRNVLTYLIGCLQREETVGATYEIAGPEILTYRQLMESYAREAGVPKPRILPVPPLAIGLSAYWIHLVTPVPLSLAKPLIESLSHPATSYDEYLRTLIPQELLTAREAIRLAIERIKRFEVESHWGDAGGVPPAEWADPGDPTWAGETAFVDRRRMVVDASPELVWHSLSRIGGATGWYYGNVLWKVRGLLDRLLGGIGLGHGRRDPVELVPGDRVDFWRVADVRAQEALILAAEMKIPGRAWLEFRLRPVGDHRSELVQTATFRPQGWRGIVYWYAVFPFHQLLFRGMLRGIAKDVGALIVSGPARLTPRASGR